MKKRFRGCLKIHRRMLYAIFSTVIFEHASGKKEEVYEMERFL